MRVNRATNASLVVEEGLSIRICPSTYRELLDRQWCVDSTNRAIDLCHIEAQESDSAPPTWRLLRGSRSTIASIIP